MPAGIQVRPISELPADFEALRAEAAEDGFGFLDRLARDWLSGENRFNQTGERLVGAFAGDRLIAVGGVNRDPYAESASIGRLRHLYVLKDWRTAGVGRALVQGLLQHAESAFNEVRLRTDTDAAAAFYRQCGFMAVDSLSASHARML
jgi:GNAT superfamily N-acetyltransferase